MNWSDRETVAAPGTLASGLMARVGPAPATGSSKPGPKSKSGQMRGVGTLVTPFPRPSLSATPASSQDTGSGEAPREREEMGQPGAGPWGTSPAQVGCGQPVPCCQQSPTSTAWGARRDQLTSSDCSYMEHSRVAGNRVLGGARGGEGWRTAPWTHMLHPAGSLSYPASVCLPTEWASVGDSGDRGARWTLGAWLRRGSHPQAAPSTAALAVAPSSSPCLLGSWEPEPALPPAGMEEGRAGPGHGHQASEGGLPYLQVLPPHVHGRKRQLHLLPPSVLVPFIGDLDEDQEDPGHDAPSHQHEDPWGRHPVPQLCLLRMWPLGRPSRVIRGLEVAEGGGPPAIFSKVRVAGALLRESHSWYRTHVLSRSSMKPFSWDLNGRGV